MSDYGSRGYGSGPEEQGWGDAGRSRGFGDSYDDYADRSPRQRGDGYGDGYGDRGGYDDRAGYGGDRGGDGYGDGYGASSGTEAYSVRSSSPHDEPPTSGRARVPGGDSTGPGRARGSARVGGKRASGLSEEEAESLKKSKKKKKRRRRLIALACVMVMFLGIGTVVGTLFFEGVPLPSEINAELDRNTTIEYADGSKMGTIGNEFGNRTLVNVRDDGKVKKDNDVPKEVKLVLLAMEDRNFYEHDGVDFWGVMRALVNNVTGGETQGASTLTQQYVGTVKDIRGDGGYMRKAEEAVMAMKMDDKYSKDEIIEHYLNLVYMGRGSYGLGAAVKAWYGEDKKVKDLTASEAAIIFAQVKSPDSSFDPTKAGNDKKLKERWEYALKGMAKEGWLKKDKEKKYLEKFPKITDTYAMSADSGRDKPTGFVSHSQVLSEAKKNYGLDEKNVRSKGYTIETTINPKLQKIAEKVARYKKGTAMAGQAENLRAALVAIDPRTGEVVAYYGGSQDGTHADKAKAVHAQGSAFKEVTISAALKAGWGPESRWDGSSPRKFEERANGELRNSGEGKGANKPNVTLREATVQSLNTPMYAISTEVGANTIVKLARSMGVTQMEVPKIDTDDKNAPPELYNLYGKKADKALNNKSNPRAFADNEVSFGQFPVSVVDMAAVNSTLANKGIYKETHFIKKITDAEGKEVPLTRELTGQQAISESVANDATDILTGVHPKYMGGNTLPNGQQFAAKSGTWERSCDNDCNESASISFAGYVPELAASAWVGDKDKENGSVTENGVAAYGAGITGSIWGKFMEEAVTVKGFDSMGKFTKGPGGKGAKPSEVEDKGDGEDGEDGEDGHGGGNGNDDECEEDPTLPQCNGGTQPPTCEQEPTNPECSGTPDCAVNPTHPQCGGGQSPDCNAFPRPPGCPENGRTEQDGLLGERAPTVGGADWRAPDSTTNRYAIRQSYRHG